MWLKLDFGPSPLDSECNANILTENPKSMNLPTYRTVFCETISKWCKPPISIIGGGPSMPRKLLWSFKSISREAYQEKNIEKPSTVCIWWGKTKFRKVLGKSNNPPSPSIGKTLAFNSLRGLEAELSVRGLMGGNAMPECPDAILGRHGRGYIRLYRVDGTSKGERRMTHQHQKT